MLGLGIILKADLFLSFRIASHIMAWPRVTIVLDIMIPLARQAIQKYPRSAAAIMGQNIIQTHDCGS